LPRRRELRNEPTAAENTLWQYLKGARLRGRKFRRQHGIESFIVDFYCPSEQLIVELDGEVHNNSAQAEYDKIREDRLRELGFRIIRFENRLVFEQTEAVLEAIASTFSQRE
jgi:very-short-patch-repair endonuclease